MANKQKLLINKSAFRRELDLLERDISEHVKTEYCVIARDVGTAFNLALRGAGVQRGDGVLCTALGPNLIVKAIESIGAIPIFVDINPDTFNMDPYCVQYVLNRSIRCKELLPKALIATNQFGLPCNYKDLEAICSSYGVMLIEDMTQSFGGGIDGRLSGDFGHFSVGALQDYDGAPEESGLVFCHNEQDARVLRGLRNYFYDYNNSVEDEVRRHVNVILASQRMKTVKAECEMRGKIAGRYIELLSKKIKLQKIHDGFQSSWSRMVVSMPDYETRASVMDSLMEQHVPCGIYYPVPLHQRFESDWKRRLILANAERASQKLLALPMHPHLTDSAVDYICNCLLCALNGGRARTEAVIELNQRFIEEWKNRESRNQRTELVKA